MFSRRWFLVALLCLATVGGLAWYFHDRPRYRDGIRYDPIEDDPRMKAVLEIADGETQQEIANDPPEWKRLGYCHHVWGVKKRILKEKYGVDWRTPPEMNPEVAFD